MCKVIEELVKEERQDLKEEIVEKMLHNKALPLEEIAKYVDLSLDEVKRIQAGLSA